MNRNSEELSNTFAYRPQTVGSYFTGGAAAC